MQIFQNMEQYSTTLTEFERFSLLPVIMLSVQSKDMIFQ